MDYSGQVKAKFYKNKEKPTTRLEPVYSLRVSEKDKYTNNHQWFKDYMEYIVPAQSSPVSNYKEMKLSYEVLNNNLSGFKQELDNFCNPLGENIGQIEEDILPYPKLHNAVNVLKGELLKRNDNHRVVLLTAKAIKDKDEQLINAIKASVDEEVFLEITKIQKELEGMPPEKAQEYIEQLRTQKSPEDLLQKEFLSESEVFYSKILKYCVYDQDVKLKQQETFEDALVADRCFIYSGWLHGKPYLEIRNPLYCGFHKSPNERYVHKGDYFWYKKPITIAEVYNNYATKLTQEEIESLGVHTYSNNQRVDRRHNVVGGEADYVFDHTSEEMFKEATNNTTAYYEDKSVGTHQGQGVSRNFNKESLIWETHFEFKAFRKMIFLSYMDEFNQKITVQLSDDFEIPKTADKVKFVNMYGDDAIKHIWIEELSGTQYEAEILWIPRKYEVVRLGSDVYPVCREVPFQNTNIETPYSSFELSTKGAIFSARNAPSVSTLQRALPVYFQYIYIKHIQNRELSKYQGAIQSIDIDQIPDALGKDHLGDEMRDKVATYLYFLKRTNKDFFSGSQTTLGAAPPSTRSPGSNGFMLGTAVELLNLQNLLEFVEREMLMAMGISPQRMSMFSQSSNVSDNQQAITQSHHITEPLYYIHSEVWRHALKDYLINFRTYAENIFLNNPELKEHSLHYILPNNTEELLKITPSMLSHEDIGLYLSNAGNDRQYLEAMMQLSHAFAQNSAEHGIETVSALIKSITNGSSPEETHKLIQMYSNRQNERMAQSQQAGLESTEKLKQMEIDNREDIQAFEMEKLEREYFHKKEIETIKALGFSQNTDADQDGTPDVIEVMKFGHDVEVEAKKLEQQDRKLDQEDKKIELKKKEVEIKGRKPPVKK